MVFNPKCIQKNSKTMLSVYCGLHTIKKNKFIKEQEGGLLPSILTLVKIVLIKNPQSIIVYD